MHLFFERRIIQNITTERFKIIKIQAMTKPTANGNLIELVSLAMPPRLGNEGGPSPKREKEH